MSPSTLALTILGATVTSTGIGIAVVNLTNINNEIIEKKIEKLWEEISGNISLLTAQVSTILKDKDSDIGKKYRNILIKITNIADSTTQNPTTYSLKSYVNHQEMYEKLQNINQELKEILEILEKAKKLAKT